MPATVHEPLAEPRERGPRTQFECIDGLRAIAALSVLILHTTFATSIQNGVAMSTYVVRLEVGVAVFFVLSGFLLYRPFVVAHLAPAEAPPTTRYLKRRLTRIFPAYWVALVATLVLLSPQYGLKDWLIFGGLFQIYSQDHILGGLTPAWSLCTEMSFYLFLPAWAWVVGRRARSPRAQLAIEIWGVVALYAVSVGVRIYLALAVTPLGRLPHAWLPARLDWFALGMALAVASAWLARPGAKPSPRCFGTWFPAACWTASGIAYVIVCVAFALPTGLFAKTTVLQDFAQQFFFGVVSVFLVAPAVFGAERMPSRIHRLLAHRALRWLGIISYGIFLWNQFFVNCAERMSFGKDLSQFWMKLAINLAWVLVMTIALAWLSYTLVERPLLRRTRATVS